MTNPIDFNQLLEAGVHFGHGQEYWNSKMAPYLYGVRRKVHIINLLKTRALLQKAASFLQKVAGANGKILYVATKRQAQEAIAEQASRVGMPYVNKRWPGGMLTNFKTILQSVERMKYLETFLVSDEALSLKKKERLSLERDLQKLKASFNGIRDMGSLPDCLFVIDVGQEHIAVREANKLGIPVVGVVDTNCTPEGIDYVVPGNDDSHKAIQLYLQTVTDAVEPEVKRVRLEEEKRAVVMKGKEVTVVKKKASVKPEQAEAADQVAQETSDQSAVAESDSTETKADNPKVKKIAKVSVDQARKALEKKKQEGDETEEKAKTVKKTVRKATAAKKVDKDEKLAASTKSKSTASKAKDKPTATKAKVSKKTAEGDEKAAEEEKKPAAAKKKPVVKKEAAKKDSDDKDA